MEAALEGSVRGAAGACAPDLGGVVAGARDASWVRRYRERAPEVARAEASAEVIYAAAGGEAVEKWPAVGVLEMF